MEIESQFDDKDKLGNVSWLVSQCLVSKGTGEHREKHFSQLKFMKK